MAVRFGAFIAFEALARNFEAERQACDVRLRAERRTGELLALLARAPHGDRKSESVSNGGALIEQSPYAQALIDNDLPRQTAHRYQQLAAATCCRLTSGANARPNSAP